ncbi:hypothetical protein [Flavobacterium sedimenticola]|uniref:Uncharacterized protein n=1 Tax=Flavobacterium sedimenticola TaxID=3043286 RepID=A0ABT6XNU1_9FLAO|nr:hypothetical protein [Flavobacterium sedimenticola]MDI9256741.1 hypothetical protein [Flavobacterium sedimenticola]
MMQFDEATQKLCLVNLEQIFVERDLRYWKSELAIAKVEMAFCNNLFTLILQESKVHKPSKYRNILGKLSQLQQATTVFEDRLQHLTLQFEGYSECDDMQCDQFYMSNHLDFREKIEKHFLQYRKLKKKLLSVIHSTKNS